ncbi:hypothetical protein GT93_05745 [Pseudomonas plecoglossicida]|nr:hypothetical protein GT93_05745 [Pseudomonas plecoglossicida]
MDKVARDYRYVKLQVKSYFDWKAPVPVKPMSPSKEVDERGKEPSAPPYSALPLTARSVRAWL